MVGKFLRYISLKSVISFESKAKMEDYISRNVAALEEGEAFTNPLRLSDMIVGQGSNMYFVPTNPFKLSFQKRLVQTGVKIPISDNFTRGQESRFYQALTNMALIHEKSPELRNELPLFYGLLADQNGNSKGIITEDFSLGGAHQVKEYREFSHANIPDGLAKLFDPEGFDMSQLEHALFYVNGESKIGDLDHLCVKEDYKEDFENLMRKVVASTHQILFTRVSLEELFLVEAEKRYADLVMQSCKSGEKTHTDVLHVDTKYEIDMSTTRNKVLNTLVNNWHLNVRRNDDDIEEKMFSLA